MKTKWIECLSCDAKFRVETEDPETKVECCPCCGDVLAKLVDEDDDRDDDQEDAEDYD